MRRISELVVMSIDSSLPPAGGQYMEEYQMVLTFTAVEEIQDSGSLVTSDVLVQLIVSNEHNGYYSHDAIAMYDGKTHNTHL